MTHHACVWALRASFSGEFGHHMRRERVLSVCSIWAVRASFTDTNLYQADLRCKSSACKWSFTDAPGDCSNQRDTPMDTETRSGRAQAPRGTAPRGTDGDRDTLGPRAGADSKGVLARYSTECLRHGSRWARYKTECLRHGSQHTWYTSSTPTVTTLWNLTVLWESVCSWTVTCIPSPFGLRVVPMRPSTARSSRGLRRRPDTAPLI